MYCVQRVDNLLLYHAYSWRRKNFKYLDYENKQHVRLRKVG